MSVGSGSVVLVTGANAGLGLEVARAFAGMGATVLLACRNQAKAAAAAEAIGGDTAVVPLDLADLASVRKCADHVSGEYDRLDVLANNAGLMAVDHGTTVDGFETQFGVNHLGHFALAAHLAPLVLATPGSRIVTMSSFGHRLGRLHLDDLMFERRYDRWRPYFQSKLANLLFTAELHRRLTEAGSGTLAVAAHPGASRTDLGYEGGGLTNRIMRISGPFLQPVAMGALPLVRAATADDVQGGQFYGPRWMWRGRPRLETPSRRARNAEDATALWERSEALTGVPFRP